MENKLALLRRLPLSDADRFAMKTTFSIDVDPLGDEILSGLTFDESRWLIKYRKTLRWNLEGARPMAADRNRAYELEARHQAASVAQLNRQDYFRHDLID